MEGAAQRGERDGVGEFGLVSYNTKLPVVFKKITQAHCCNYFHLTFNISDAIRFYEALVKHIQFPHKNSIFQGFICALFNINENCNN